MSPFRPLSRLSFPRLLSSSSSLAQVSAKPSEPMLPEVRLQASLMTTANRTGYFPISCPSSSTGRRFHRLLATPPWSRIPSLAPLLPTYTAAYGSYRDPLTVPEYCSLQYPRRFGSAKIKHTPSSHNRPLALDCVGYRGGR